MHIPPPHQYILQPHHRTAAQRVCLDVSFYSTIVDRTSVNALVLTE